MTIYETLRRIFNGVEDINVRAALQDLFAVGCYLHATGRQDVGWKACATALRAMRTDDTVERAILDQLPHKERECFEASWPHSELKCLMSEM